MTPFAFFFPASQRLKCLGRLKNAHGASFPLTDANTFTPELPSRYNRHIKHAGENRARLLTFGCVLANIPSVMSAMAILPQFARYRNALSGVSASVRFF